MSFNNDIPELNGSASTNVPELNCSATNSDALVMQDSQSPASTPPKTPVVVKTERSVLSNTVLYWGFSRYGVHTKQMQEHTKKILEAYSKRYDIKGVNFHVQEKSTFAFGYLVLKLSGEAEKVKIARHLLLGNNPDGTRRVNRELVKEADDDDEMDWDNFQNPFADMGGDHEGKIFVDESGEASAHSWADSCVNQDEYKETELPPLISEIDPSLMSIELTPENINFHIDYMTKRHSRKGITDVSRDYYEGIEYRMTIPQKIPFVLSSMALSREDYNKESGSTIISSNMPTHDWNRVIDDKYLLENFFGDLVENPRMPPNIEIREETKRKGFLYVRITFYSKMEALTAVNVYRVIKIGQNIVNFNTPKELADFNYKRGREAYEKDRLAAYIEYCGTDEVTWDEEAENDEKFKDFFSVDPPERDNPAYYAYQFPNEKRDRKKAEKRESEKREAEQKERRKNGVWRTESVSSIRSDASKNSSQNSPSNTPPKPVPVQVGNAWDKKLSYVGEAPKTKIEEPAPPVAEEPKEKKPEENTVQASEDQDTSDFTKVVRTRSREQKTRSNQPHHKPAATNGQGSYVKNGRLQRARDPESNRSKKRAEREMERLQRAEQVSPVEEQKSVEEKPTEVAKEPPVEPKKTEEPAKKQPVKSAWSAPPKSSVLIAKTTTKEPKEQKEHKNKDGKCKRCSEKAAANSEYCVSCGRTFRVPTPVRNAGTARALSKFASLDSE